MQTISHSTGKMLLVFLAAVTLFAGCAPPGARALFRGKKQLEKREFAEAVESFKTACELLGRTNAQAFNYLGLACHEAGRSDDAVRAYQRALALNPDLAEANYNLGCLLAESGKLEQANGELTAFTLQRGNVADGWVKLAAVKLRLAESSTAPRGAELSAAEKNFKQALQLEPDNAEALNGLGLVCLQRRRPAEAAECFRSALKTHPLYAPAMLNLAIVAQQYLGDRGLAMKTYRSYVALTPTPENAEAVKQVLRTLEFESAAPHPQASHPPEVAANRPVPMPETMKSPASTLASNQVVRTVPSELPETLAAPPKAVSTSPVSRSGRTIPSSPSSNLPVATLPSEPVIRTAQEPVISPITAPNETVASSAHSTTNSAPEPRTGSTKVVARYAYRSPARPRAGKPSEAAERIFAQALQAQQAQRLAEAMDGYRRAAQLAPGFYEAYYNLARAATEAGNRPLALSTYEMALAIRPQSPEARYNFALVLKQSNYFIDAATELEKIVLNYPNDSRSHLALGNLYAQQLDQPLKAREHYLKVLENDPRIPQASAIRDWLTVTSH